MEPTPNGDRAIVFWSETTTKENRIPLSQLWKSMHETEEASWEKLTAKGVISGMTSRSETFTQRLVHWQKVSLWRRSQQIVPRCHHAFNIVTKLTGKRGFYSQLFHPSPLVAPPRIILLAGNGNTANALVLGDLTPPTCREGRVFSVVLDNQVL